VSILRPQFPAPGQPSHRPRLDYANLPRTGREVDPEIGTAEYQRRLDLMNRASQTAYMHASVECGKNAHRPAQCVFACDHCVEQDPVHPVGMIFTPFKYFLCMKCYHQHMVRKLDLAYKLKAQCNQCIIDEWERIKKIDPTKVRDFLKDGVY